jgi:hypothetical protein
MPMLMKEGDLIVNQKGNPVALLKECENCILINKAYWNDRGIRNKVSELVGGTRKQLKMPHEIYVELAEKQADSLVGKGWL